MMRYKEQDTNQTINNVALGEVTIVKTLSVDTMGQDGMREKAKKFAEAYAEEHNLKVVMSRISLGRWFTKGIGMTFDFANK